MSVTICSLAEAEKIHDQFDYVISITDPRVKLPSFGKYHLHVKFQDTADPTEHQFRSMKTGASKIYNWATEHGLNHDSKILVHCHAGISRSSAIAWSLLVMFGDGYIEAFKKIYMARPQIWPNLILLALMDAKMGQDGEFYQAAQVVDMELYNARYGG